MVMILVLHHATIQFNDQPTCDAVDFLKCFLNHLLVSSIASAIDSEMQQAVATDCDYS
jgi:hypothetical protein